MTAVLVPDAPWIANIIMLLIVAAIPSAFAVRARHAANKASDVAKTAHVDSTEKLDRVLHNVENSHSKGLRDDLDEKVQGIDDKIGSIADSVQSLAEDLRGAFFELSGTHVDIGNLHDDISSVRGDVRTNRSRLNHLDRRFENAMDQAQALLDHNHPGQSLFSDDSRIVDVEFSPNLSQRQHRRRDVRPRGRARTQPPLDEPVPQAAAAITEPPLPELPELDPRLENPILHQRPGRPDTDETR